MAKLRPLQCRWVDTELRVQSNSRRHTENIAASAVFLFLFILCLAAMVFILHGSFYILLSRYSHRTRCLHPPSAVLDLVGVGVFCAAGTAVLFQSAAAAVSSRQA